ncbi:MAG: DUF4105 domain-containing protein [Gammaproteobacteria bacterium]|nr:DUF4105 domain-containing protein [Gammaproteobacteria bacterium]
MRKLFFILCLGCCYSSAVYCNDDIDDVIHYAVANKLHESDYWRALLHYKSVSQSTPYSWESEISTPAFFISEAGKTEPLSELLATIRAIYSEPLENHNAHAQCLFVARYQWLKKNIQWRTKPPLVNCKKYKEYSSNGHVDSVSVIFATGFLGNPASYYGHILIKLNNKRDYNASGLLDQVMNYGAVVPDNENGIVYVVKGLFGGYDSVFSHEKFYRNNHIYVENELRDMWEYKLDLTEDEVEQIVAHSWELLGKHFVYYFSRENCAYRMGELLELVVNEPLYSRHAPWSLPADVFERLIKIKKADAPLVKEVKWIPSRQSSFYRKYQLLNEKQKSIVGLLANKLEFEADAYSKATAKDKAIAIDTLFDYFEYRMTLEKHNTTLKNKKLRLIRERFLISEKGGVESSQALQPAPPHAGPVSSMLRYGVYTNSLLGTGISLRGRPAYFDALSLDEGRMPNSTLTMMDIELALLNDELTVKRFDLVNVETLNVSQTGLPGDGGSVWRMNIGFANQNLGCVRCEVFKAEGGIGRAVKLFSGNTMLYAMAELGAQTEHEDSGTVAWASHIGLIGHLQAAWKSRLIIGYKEYVNGTQTGNNIVKWENRFGISRNWDIRLSYEKNLESEFYFGAGFYW